MQRWNNEYESIYHANMKRDYKRSNNDHESQHIHLVTCQATNLNKSPCYRGKIATTRKQAASTQQDCPTNKLDEGTRQLIDRDNQR